MGPTPRIVTAILSLILLSASAAPAEHWRYRVDPSASGVNAKVAFLGLASKTARFPSMAGSLSLPEQEDTARTRAITLAVTLDARALQAPDAVTLKRLRGADFFDVERYPAVRFTGQTLKMTGMRTADVAGTLAVRGVTRPETLHVTFDRAPGETRRAQPLQLTGTMRIDRRAYGMTAWSMVVGRKVDITIRTRLVPE